MEAGDERLHSNGHGWVRRVIGLEGTWQRVGHKQLRSKGHGWGVRQETSDRAREDMMEVGQTVALEQTRWRLETSGRAQKDLVEAGDERTGSRGHGGDGIQAVALKLTRWGVGDEQSGSREHGGGGTPAVVFELTQQGLETSGRARKDVVEVRQARAGKK